MRVLRAWGSHEVTESCQGEPKKVSELIMIVVLLQDRSKQLLTRARGCFVEDQYRE